MVTNHATLVHVLKQICYKLTDRQTHWVEELMPYANLMCILYKKGIIHEIDPVTRRPEFFPVDNLRGPYECLRWDGNVPRIETNSKY